MSLRRRRILFAGLAAVILLLGVGWAAYRHEVREELSPVGRGERLAQASGCFACHGRSEAEYRGNARRTRDGAWQNRTIPTLWENGLDEAEVIISWITDGCPPEERERHRQWHVQMPAYGDKFLRDGEIDAIAAWILAQGLQYALSAPPVTTDAVEPLVSTTRESTHDTLWRRGDQLARSYGCYQCHGELGQGGVPNPASFKAYIPGFFGEDFRQLTDGGSREEIRHWIEHGRGGAIEAGWLGGIARRFFERQAIGMPAYGERLSAQELDVLTDFLLLLNERGPLAARDVEQIARQLQPEM